MKTSLFTLAAVGAAGLALTAPTAAAQATRTWVSGVGDDVNPCSRTAPCKTFAGAISKTAAGGEINVIDPGGFGSVTITKSITINGYGAMAGVLAPSTNGIVVNAGPTDVVTLRHLSIDGSGSGLNGVRFLAGAALHVDSVHIRGFAGASGWGIAFRPSGRSELHVSDTLITDSGGGASGGGLMIQPTGSGSASATVTRVTSLNNVHGYAVSTEGLAEGRVSLTLVDSVASGGASAGVAVLSPTGTGNAAVIVSGGAFTNNNTAVRAQGSGASASIGRASITANAKALQAADGARILSFGTNQFEANGALGSEPGSARLQ